MTRRLDAGGLVAAAGALLLLVALFLHWWGDPGLTAWQAYESWDVVLAGAALVVLAVVVRGPEADRRVLVGAAVVVALVVATQVIGPPPPALRGAGRDVGAWLALVAALLVAAGTVLAGSAISVSVDVRGREPRRRAAAIDRRATAEAAGVGAARSTPSAPGAAAGPAPVVAGQDAQPTATFTPAFAEDEPARRPDRER